jgi:SAM-dependent methyltransferase
MSKFHNTPIYYIIQSINDLYKQTSAWGRILIFLILFGVVIFFLKPFNKNMNKTEGFISKFSYLNDDPLSQIDTTNSIDLYSETDFSVKSSVTDIYDDFYANIYDDLLYYKFKNNYEIGILINNTNPTTESNILDIGSGTGHYVGNLASRGYIIKGIDISPSMIKKAKRNYPEFESNFINGDVLNINLVNPNSLTHINCMNLTIYYIKNKPMFFQNCMNWLMPGGYLLLHLVNKNNFTYKIPSSGLFNNDKTTEKQTNNSRIIQNKVNIPKYNIDYSSNFELYNNDSNTATISEKFKEIVNNSEKIRKNLHTLYMESVDEIVNLGLNEGFILQGMVDMGNIEFSHQNHYIYIFTKPN